jgi:reactive intermediate/imine deaminase
MRIDWLQGEIERKSFLVLLGTVVLLFTLGTFAYSQDAAQPPADSPPTTGTSELLEYWQAHHKTPLDYLAEKFRHERWIFVGEFHRVRHDVELIVSLVPRLHETTDVRHLAMEFLCRDHTAEANRLVTAETYDRERMIDFFREQFPGWGYEEYLEIFHSTWASNRRLAEERGNFQLVGLHPCIDWETVNYGTDPAAVAAEQKKQDRYDEIMAEVLEESVLRPGHKALIFTGIAHATGKFAEYRYGTEEQLLRMGNLVYREPYREDMFFVALHAPFYDHGTSKEIYPFDGVLDELMLSFGKDIGFDVVGTPFGSLVHRDRSKHAITAYSFGEVYDGYVMYRTPIKEYVGVTCIDDWITDEQEFRHYTRHVTNKKAGEAFAKLSLEEFRAEHCAPRPDHGVEFSRRFRKLPDVKGAYLIDQEPRPFQVLDSGSVFPSGLPFSEAVRVGDTLFLSGQVGNKPGTLELVPGGIEAEARQTLENIKRTLEAHGYSMRDIVKCTVMLADISEWATFNEIYKGYFDTHYPARSAFGANGLALGARVELECIAAAGGR